MSFISQFHFDREETVSYQYNTPPTLCHRIVKGYGVYLYIDKIKMDVYFDIQSGVFFSEFYVKSPRIIKIIIY